MGLVPSVEGSSDGLKEGNVCQACRPGSPSIGWLINNGPYSNVVSDMVK